MTDRDGPTRRTGRGPRSGGREPTRAVGFALVVFVGSVIPVPSSSGGQGALGGVLDALPAEIGLTDPFHLVGYAVLAALLARSTRGNRRGALLAVLGATAFGFGIELVQAPIPWRSFAWRDAAVNAVGAAVGTAIATVGAAVAAGRDRKSVV